MLQYQYKHLQDSASYTYIFFPRLFRNLSKKLNALLLGSHYNFTSHTRCSYSPYARRKIINPLTTTSHQVTYHSDIPAPSNEEAKNICDDLIFPAAYLNTGASISARRISNLKARGFLNFCLYRIHVYPWMIAAGAASGHCPVNLKLVSSTAKRNPSAVLREASVAAVGPPIGCPKAAPR